MFTEIQNKALAAKLDPDCVKSREQAGRRVSYVEGWHVIAEANRIFGFDGWTRETVRLEETNRDLVSLKGSRGDYQQWRVGYLAVVTITAGGVTRQGTGFGSGMAKPEALGEAIESAAKEAETDAMKRALSTFGNPFGLALYDKTQENVGRDTPPQAREPEPDGTPFDEPALPPSRAQADTYRECVAWLKKAANPDDLKKRAAHKEYLQGTATLTEQQKADLRAFYLDTLNALKSELLMAG
jgi:DNA repair and recombination protein RAD52